MEKDRFVFKDWMLSIRKMLIPALFLVLVNQFAYWFSRVLTTGRTFYDFSFDFEDRIPLMPWTSVIYLGCYLFWLVNLGLACYQKDEKSYRLFCAEALGKLTCFLFFVIIPTATIRPEINGSTIWDKMMLFIYNVDPANNLFPSIHCYMSTICVLAVWYNPKISRVYKWASVIITFLIYLSTLTTKQHFLVDIIGGAVLANVSYWVVNKINLTKPYMELMKKFTPKKFMVEID